MIYHVVSNDEDREVGDYLAPVTDGTYYTKKSDKNGDDIFIEHKTGDFALCFYDADGETPVTPTAGTIAVYMSPFADTWLEPGVGDKVIDATTVKAATDGIATYNLPMFVGGAVQGRIDLSGITGATYVKAQFRRFR